MITFDRGQVRGYWPTVMDDQQLGRVEIMERIEIDLDVALDSALETLLWSETMDTEDGSTGDSFEATGYSTDEIDPSGVADIRGALASFDKAMSDGRPHFWTVVAMALRLTDSTERTVRALSSWVGHNFILTANGHGAGFWDTGLGRIGEELTQQAKGASYSLYLGDDDRVYVF